MKYQSLIYMVRCMHIGSVPLAGYKIYIVDILGVFGMIVRRTGSGKEKNGQKNFCKTRIRPEIRAKAAVKKVP